MTGCEPSTSTCTCPRPTGLTAPWPATSRRPRRTSGPRWSGSPSTSSPTSTARSTRRRCCSPGTRRPRPGAPGCRTRRWRPRCAEHPDAFAGIGSVDPHKDVGRRRGGGDRRRSGCAGSSSTRRCRRSRRTTSGSGRCSPRASEHGLLALFHTGTSGIGARQPGGQGIRIDYSHPLKLDAVAAAFPELTVVAAHFGWPWHMDLLAMALHKTNVYIDISGWSPKRMPAEVIREMRGRLSGQFVWGSDFPVHRPRSAAWPNWPSLAWTRRPCCTTTPPASSAWPVKP